MSQFLWYNIYIQIDEGGVHLSRFSQNNLNFVSQLFNTNGLIKARHLLKQEYHLNNNSNFQWLQLINSVPEKWKLTIKQSSSDAKNIILHGHHLIKSSWILILEKLTSKELCQILISSRTNKVTSVTYFETKFNANSLDWTKIFILSRLITYNTYLRSFQYKILHNILFLNEKLYLSNNKMSTMFLLQYKRWNTNTFVLRGQFCQMFMATTKQALPFWFEVSQIYFYQIYSLKHIKHIEWWQENHATYYNSNWTCQNWNQFRHFKWTSTKVNTYRKDLKPG